jgi:hypothetical protein
MSTIVHIGKRQLTAERICEYVSQSHLLPQVLREIIIDEALAAWNADRAQIDLPEDESEFTRCYQEIASLPAHQGMNPTELEAIARRHLQIQQFKQENWGHKLTTHYLVRKSELDRVIYSIMRIPNATIAQEIYFRVQAGEKTFAALAAEYSQGIEAKNGGKIGPVLLYKVQPEIAKQLVYLQPGQLSPLFIVDNFYGFVRLEKLIHAEFDDRMKQTLLDELFEKWLQEKISSEIGLVSLETKVTNPDFMHNYNHAIYDGIDPAREPQPSLALAKLPTAVPEKTPETLTLQRGDTGLLMAQLQSLMVEPVPSIAEAKANTELPEVEAIAIPQSEGYTNAPASPTDTAQAQTEATPVEGEEDNPEPRPNKLLVGFLLLLVAIGCGGASFFAIRSLGIDSIVQIMQKVERELKIPQK